MAIQIKIGSIKAPVHGLDYDRVEINKIALIDADKYKHKVTYRIWQSLMQEGLLHNQALLNEKIDGYLSYEVFNRFKADSYVFCFSAPSSKVFRNAVTQEKKYKGNRNKGEDPYFYTNKFDDMAYIYEYINSRYQTLFVDDLEADDILAMVQNENTFIYSEDKDLKQVPGWHWDQEQNQIIPITQDDAMWNLISQLVKGDGGDGIPGLKAFGDVAVLKFDQEVLVKNLDINGAINLAISKYTDKLGIYKGYDTFVEMWTLLNMRTNRGEYTREKYAKIFTTIDELCKANGYGTT